MKALIDKKEYDQMHQLLNEVKIEFSQYMYAYGTSKCDLYFRICETLDKIKK